MSEAFWATTLLLIRHAQARSSDGFYGQSTPLSELGRLQAAALAAALVAGTPPSVVYTSSLPRAQETAAPLCVRLNLKSIVDTRLAEFELGTASLESTLRRPDLLIWRPDHRGVENGETLSEFSARVAAFCEEVVERHPGELVAVVSHSGTIDAAIRWSLGLTPSSAWQHEFDLSTGSITEIEFWPRGRVRGGAPRYAVLRRIGDVSHMGDLISQL